MWPISILKRYVWSLLIISAIPPLFLTYYYFDALQNIHLEQRKQILIAISAKVEQQMRPLFDPMVDTQKDLTPDQIMKLHDVLQPVIERIQAEYPEYTVGISSPMFNGVIAMAPGFSVDKMGKGMTPLAKTTYNTGNFNFAIINHSLSQNGNTVMGVAYPVFYKGQVIANTWSNIQMKQYFWERIEQMTPSFLMVFIAWIGVLGLSWQLYLRFNNAIGDVVKYLISGEDSGKNISLFPEMNIVKDTMQDLRAKKRQSEEEIARLDRLNLVGEMAAGIGHEVRNPMTTVRGYLQMFMKKQEFTNYHEQVSTMIDELDRANCIITEFLSLAKNKAIEMKCGNLNRVITALFPLLQADAFRVGHEIRIELDDIPDSIFDEKEIRQLILNLVRNGLEAMEYSGVVTIRTYVDNDQVILSVKDIGVGIPAEVMDKIGTPFMTTKEQGTGLGLAVCYRVAHRHGAKIDVSTGSTGTTFTINFLPQALEMNAQ
jgi:signal transduction histidine kinase